MPAKIKYIPNDNTTRPFPDAFEVDGAEFKINGDYVCVEPCGGGGGGCNVFEGYSGLKLAPFESSVVGCGGHHSIAIKLDGTLWGTGYNGHGELGLGDGTDRNEFTQAGTDTNWKSVDGGNTHTIALKLSGTLWGTGENGSGQLGLGISPDRNEFTQIGTDNDWSEITCDNYYSIAIKSDGTLWGTGRNNYGQLGLGDEIDRNEFTQIGTNTDWKSVSCGSLHSIALKTDGTLWSTGRNNRGQLGLGDNNNRDEFTQVGTDINWESVSCGEYHSIALKTNGTFWSTGYNQHGQLGLGDNGSGTNRNIFTQVGTDIDWNKIVCGWLHSTALKINGTLWGTGENSVGQLGLGDNINRNVFTQVGTDIDWKSTSCGYYYSIVIKENNFVWGTGYNYRGQLGLGDNGWGTNRNIFTQVFYDKLCSNSIFIDENTTSPGEGQYLTPFSSLNSAFEWLRETCAVIPDDINLTIYLDSNLNISNITSLNHPYGYNMILDGNNNQIYYDFNIIDENSDIESKLNIYDNHFINIKNLEGNINLNYTSIPFTQVGNDIYVNGGTLLLDGTNSTSYNLEIVGLKSKDNSVLDLSNCTSGNLDSEIMILEIISNIEYKIIYMNKYSVLYDKSIGTIENNLSENIIIDISKIEVPDLTYNITNWLAKNDSTIIITSDINPLRDITNENSTVIFNGTPE